MISQCCQPASRRLFGSRQYFNCNFATFNLKLNINDFSVLLACEQAFIWVKAQLIEDYGQGQQQLCRHVADAVAPCNLSRNLSRNFVAIQVTCKITRCNIPRNQVSQRFCCDKQCVTSLLQPVSQCPYTEWLPIGI